jgi:hypothetical protein
MACLLLFPRVGAKHSPMILPQALLNRQLLFVFSYFP